MSRSTAGSPSGAIWLDTPAPGRWADEAACRRFPELAGYFTEAATFTEGAVGMAICGQCPALQACLDYGITLRADGVWGGQLLRNGRVLSREQRPASGRASR